jgi:hypothetical protein
VTHHASPAYWTCYRALPASIQALADKAFALLKADPRHPSLHFKKVGALWSVRVGLHHRAIGVECPDGVLWFWIGTHADYDTLVS